MRGKCLELPCVNTKKSGYDEKSLLRLITNFDG